MNRRSFFTKLGLAAASLAILPAATTYARKWVAPTQINTLNPAWVNAQYECYFIMAEPVFDPVFFESPVLRHRTPLRFSMNENGILTPA